MPFTVKTISTLAMLVTVLTGLNLHAAPPPTNAPVAVPQRTNRAEAADRVVAPTLPTNPPALTTAAGALTNPAAPKSMAVPTPPPVTSTGATAATSPINMSNLPPNMSNLPPYLAARLTNLAARMPAPPPSPGAPRSATNLAAQPVPRLPGTPTVPPRGPGGPPSPGTASAASGTTPGTPTVPNPATSLTGLSPSSPGQEEEVFPPGLIKFQDADIGQVLDIYQELTGRTVMRPNNLPATKITIRSQTQLTRREAVQALDSILSLNQISMVPQGEKFVKAVPSAQAGTEGNRFNELPRSELPESGTLVSQVVRLTNQIPRDVVQALQPFAKLPNSIMGIDSAGILVLRDNAENVKRMMEILAQIDVIPQQEFESVVIPIKYALAADIAQVLGSLSTGGGATTVGHQTTRSGLTGPSGSGGLGGPGGLGQQQQGMYPGQTQYGQRGDTTGLGGSGANRSSFADRLRGIINKATSAAGGGDIVILTSTKIIADERTNSLLIFANKQDLATISNIIDKLDVVLAQVLIEALIFEVSLNDSLDYGVSYVQKQPSQSGSFAGIGALMNNLQTGGPKFLNIQNFASGSNGVPSLPGGFSYLASFGKDLDIAAAAIAGDSRFNVLSRPRIQTSHAVEANLFVGRTRPYPTGTSYGGVYGGYSSIQQLQIGITLSVLPLINPDGLVVMDIRQRTQSIGQDVEIANVGKVPETIDREANAKVAVRDHETIVLGGFISSEKRRSTSGIPLLKDIPILGHLFRSNSRSTDRQELMVLIRPTVLPTPMDAARMVSVEKRNMPGVAAAEREFNNDERQALQRSEKEEHKAQDKVANDLYRREGFSE